MERRKIIIYGIVLIGVFATFFILNGRSLRNAKKLTKELELRVDSLQEISSDYTRIQSEYEQLLNNLRDTRAKADEFRNKVSEITSNQTASVSRVRNDLRELIQEFDTLDLDMPLDTLNLDSLKF